MLVNKTKTLSDKNKLGVQTFCCVIVANDDTIFTQFSIQSIIIFIFFFAVATVPQTSDHSTEAAVKIDAVVMVEAAEQNKENHAIISPGSFEDDDIQMKWIKFPLPIKVNEQNITKREGDVFSGDIPYNDTVSFIDAI